MEKQRLIQLELSDAVDWLKERFGFEATLSEILLLRRRIDYTIDSCRRIKNSWERPNPMYEAVAELFHDHYGIHYYDL